MKDNNGSRLKVKQIITIFSILLTLSISTQIIMNKENNKDMISLSKEETQNIVTVEKANVDNTISLSKITQTTISRGSLSRRKVEENAQAKVEEEKKYITIDEIQISKDMDLTIRCGISKEDFKTLMKNLKSDTTDFFYNNSDIIYNLCEKYNVNEIFFCGLIAAESGWKISSGHRNKCNYISMMSRGSLIRYNTPEEGLEAGLKLLSTKYLTEGGSYYCGKTLASVQKRFCPNSSTWVNLVYGCMKVIV